MKRLSIYIILILLVIYSANADSGVEDKSLLKLQKTLHEKEAIKHLYELIYQKIKLTKSDILKLMYERKWMKSTNLILDFLMDVKQTEVVKEIETLSGYITTYLGRVKSWLAGKKKNIVKISPTFEWSQDNEKVKIRLRFSKNLESPGEKDIEKFNVSCERAHLEVQGYKVHDDYVAHYHRRLQLYEYIRPYTCEAKKETDGSYIIKFEKNQFTLYWNSLDQPTDDHHNTYTWFDVFQGYDNKAKYTEYRDWAMENLLISDLNDHVAEKMEEKKNRLKKIQSIAQYLKTKSYENKNYCLSPINEKFCILPTIHEWSYWLF